MSHTREALVGQTIRLRARFEDDNGNPILVTTPTITITDPDTTETVTTAAVSTVDGKIYEYSYLVPVGGPAGTWTDTWTGDIEGNPVTASFSFSVIDDGVAFSVASQLSNNNIVKVTLPTTLLATDGTALSATYEFEFMTTTSPSWTNVAKVMLSVGSFLGPIQEDTIQQAILEASLEANVLTFTSTKTNSALYNHARREYTTCEAASMLVQNAVLGGLRSKTLGDFRVEYDPKIAASILDRLRDCADHWLPQLNAAGGARTIKNPSYVVKGEMDFDRPNVSRSWSNTGENSIPAANTRALPVNSRRYQRTFLPRRGRWW